MQFWKISTFDHACLRVVQLKVLPSFRLLPYSQILDLPAHNLSGTSIVFRLFSFLVKLVKSLPSYLGGYH